MNSVSFKMTPRDREIARMLTGGMTTKEIAANLKLTRVSVKRHLRNMYERAGITDGNKQTRLLTLLVPKSEADCRNVHLTPRELDITRYVAGGLTNETTAQFLGTTAQVVKNYLRAIFDKCGVWSRQELAIWWISHRHQYEAECVTQ